MSVFPETLFPKMCVPKLSGDVSLFGKPMNVAYPAIAFKNDTPQIFPQNETQFGYIESPLKTTTGKNHSEQ